MKKAKASQDELRSEYKRSDLGKIERGKYATRLEAETNIVLLEPEIAQAFPNDKAVNNALRALLEIAKASTRLVPRPNRPLDSEG